MFCTECGGVNEESHDFCIHCGNSFQIVSENSVAEEKSILSSTRNVFCTECGGVNEESHDFCIHCGTSSVAIPSVSAIEEEPIVESLTKQEDEKVDKPPMDREKKIAIISGTVVIALFVVVFLLTGSNPQNIPVLLFLFSPLFLGEVIFLCKVEKPVLWVETFHAWIAVKRENNTGRDGFVRRWFFRPLFFCLAKTAKFTDSIVNPYLRTGVRVSASIYIIGFITYVALTVVIAFVLLGTTLWITAKVLGWDNDAPSKSTYSRVDRIAKEKKRVELKCKSCSHYCHKEWSINFECKLGRSTPDYGDTDACPSYKKHLLSGT